jgi:hypothetical protein
LIVVFLALLTFERPLTPAAPGPSRLDVDLALLAGTASDLRDLRLHNSAGREIPYLLMPPEGRSPQWVSGRVMRIAATKTSSGFEVDFGRARAIDEIRLRGIDAPFLKRARIEASGDRARWVVLSDTTLFDLPAQELQREIVEIAPGEYRYVRVTWDDRTSAPATGTPIVSARLHQSAAPAPAIVEPVPFSRRSSEPGRSRYRIYLPGPRLPLTAIELEVGQGDVFREASVTEPRLTGAEIVPVPLGNARLKRAERNGAVASDLTIPITSPESRELDLTVDDGSNAPLSITSVRVRLAPQPWIYFESDGSPLIARYGDEKREAPKYDLEAARKLIATRQLARAQWQRAPQALPSAEPAESPLPAAGAAVDRAAFRFVRPLAPAPAGLTVLRLDADVLSRSRNLHDVRLINTGAQQIPYVVDWRQEPIAVPVKIPAREQRERNTSVYPLTLPYDDFPAGTKLALQSGRRIFQRTVEVWQAADDRRGVEARLLVSTNWRAVDPDRPPPVLMIDVPERHARVLEVVLREGDNAPLPITSANLYIPSAALRFYHSGTPLSLVYGHASLGAPEYDLALLAPRLFREQAREISLAAALPKPVEDEGKERKYFWIAIAVVAAGLLALLVKLLAPLLREEARPLS